MVVKICSRQYSIAGVVLIFGVWKITATPTVLSSSIANGPDLLEFASAIGLEERENPVHTPSSWPSIFSRDAPDNRSPEPSSEEIDNQIVVPDCSAIDCGGFPIPLDTDEPPVKRSPVFPGPNSGNSEIFPGGQGPTFVGYMQAEWTKYVSRSTSHLTLNCLVEGE